MDEKLAALTLLKDWSNILLTVQMGAIAFIGTLLPKTPNRLAKFFAVVSIVCFTLSIGWAAQLLGSLPVIAQRIKSVGSIYEEPGNLGIPIETSASWQAIFFGAGVFFFTAFVSFRRSGKKEA